VAKLMLRQPTVTIHYAIMLVYGSISLSSWLSSVYCCRHGPWFKSAGSGQMICFWLISARDYFLGQATELDGDLCNTVTVGGI